MRIAEFYTCATRHALRGKKRAVRWSPVLAVAIIACLAARTLYAQCVNYTVNARSVGVNFAPCSDTTTCFTIPDTFTVYCTNSSFKCNRYMNTNPPNSWANCAQNVGSGACSETVQPCGETNYYQAGFCTLHWQCEDPLNGLQPLPGGGWADMGPMTWCQSPIP
jgi:hypothetical protein